MSTLRVSNIEAKAFPSSPSVDEKVKVTNSNGDILLHLDGTTSGIGSIGIGTTGTTFRVDPNNTVTFPGNVISSGIVTASSLSGNLTGNVTGNVTGTVTELATNATGANLTLTGNLGVGGTITYEDVARVDATGISTFREGYKVGPLTGIALTAYKDGSIRTSGIITASSFTGTVASSNLSGALPALDGSALTGVGVGTDDSINTSGIITATSLVPTEGHLSHRNILSNGACLVAQRATSNTNDQQGYKTVDRFRLTWGGADSIIEQHQGGLTSSDTGPWEKGFRKEFHVVNGNQSSGAGAGDWTDIQYVIEAQDIAASGWDYTSSSSYITLSFWFKAQVANTYYCYLYANDCTKGYAIPLTVSANTWTKFECPIPGASGLQFNFDNDQGLKLIFVPFYGTDFTASGSTVNAWKNHSSSSYFPDMGSGWWTQDNATFQLTGLQLEVGSVATPFEHRTYGDELRRCQRYLFKLPSAYPMFADRTTDAHNCGRVGMYWFNQPMRAAPTMSDLSMTVYTGSSQTLQAYSVTKDFVWFNHTGSFSDGRAWAKINSFTASAELNP